MVLFLWILLMDQELKLNQSLLCNPGYQDLSFCRVLSLILLQYLHIHVTLLKEASQGQYLSFYGRCYLVGEGSRDNLPMTFYAILLHPLLCFSGALFKKKFFMKFSNNCNFKKVYLQIYRERHE